MADPPEGKELQLKSADAAAAAIQPSNEERHDAPSDPSDSDNKELATGEKHDVDTDDIAMAASPHRLDVTKSVATDASYATSPPATKARPWYRQVNPLRWGGVPPVPKERIVSREYTAGFFSKLTFQWMTPLMTVSRIVAFDCPQIGIPSSVALSLLCPQGVAKLTPRPTTCR